MANSGGACVSVSEEGQRFADRLAEACEALNARGGGNHGRLTWLARELKAKFGTTVSVETVRKWFAGISLPRPDKMKQIAQLLQVDVAWLSLGPAPLERHSMQFGCTTSSMDVVSLMAGFVELQGGAVAFPRSKTSATDFFAIVGGEHFSCVVRLGRDDKADGSAAFEVPAHRGDNTVLVVLPSRQGFALDIFYVPEALLSRACETVGADCRITVQRDEKGLTLCGTRLSPMIDIHSLVNEHVGISVGT